jgi:hypothetical protein
MDKMRWRLFWSAISWNTSQDWHSYRTHLPIARFRFRLAGRGGGISRLLSDCAARQTAAGDQARQDWLHLHDHNLQNQV